MGISGLVLPVSLSDVHHDIVTCNKCARLRSYCADIARVKRAAFRNDTYWGKPVPGFGDPNARVLILGLAPAAHGANRTGRFHRRWWRRLAAIS